MPWTKGKTHKDVEFHVNDKLNGKVRVFKKFDEASAFAVQLATAGSAVNLDVCIWSEKGARWWGGPDAARDHKEDPDASVFERIAITANSEGRVY